MEVLAQIEGIDDRWSRAVSRDLSGSQVEIYLLAGGKP